MTRRIPPLFLVLLAVAALRPPKAGPAATSGPVAEGRTMAMPSGCRLPVPSEYLTSARRERDEAGASESVLLYAVGSDENPAPGASRFEGGKVLVEILPWDGPPARPDEYEADFRSAAGWTRVRRISGLPYPALAAAGAGLVRVDLVTPTRLIRVTSSRWTTAFDAVIRGFRDAA